MGNVITAFAETFVVCLMKKKSQFSAEDCILSYTKIAMLE